jgi:hypothetical protein
MRQKIVPMLRLQEKFFGEKMVTKTEFFKTLKHGFDVELEHAHTVGHDPITVARIVLDHLEEDQHYYKKLAKVEGRRY